MLRAGTLLVCLLWALGGRADESPAKRLFLSGQKHFDLGEYVEALSDFKAAYRLKDDPVLLYNVAQCERLLNHSPEALRSYRAYLRRAPQASNRGEVERKIASLEELVASQDKASRMPPNTLLENPRPEAPAATPAPTPPPAPTATPEPAPAAATASAPPPPPRRQPLYKKWWLWTAVGVVVVAGVGVGLGVGLTRESPTTFPGVSF